MVHIAEPERTRACDLNLSLGTPERVVNPPHPHFPDETVRVGFIKSSNTWVLIEPPNGIRKDYRHLGACSLDHCADLEILDSAELLERECDGPPGSYVVRLIPQPE